jgi:hypothetical protein
MPYFDIHSRASLYGAYTDDFITGSFLVEKDLNGKPVVNSKRGRTISKYISSLLNNFPVNSIILPQNFENSYSEYRTALTNSMTLINKSNRFINAVSENEYYYDSFVPDMNGIFEVDNGKLILINTPKGGAEQIALFEYIFGCQTYSSSLGMYINHTLKGPNNEQISNDKWIKSFPFEIKYRKVARLQGKPFSIENLYYSVSGSIYNHSFIDVYPTSSVKKPITSLPTKNSGFWGNIPNLNFIKTSVNITFSFLFPSGALPTNPYSNNQYDPQHQTLHGILADKTSSANSSVEFDEMNLFFSSSKQSSTIKFLYGFGDGFNGLGEFLTDVPNSLFGISMASVYFGSLIRGWKYGLKSGFPEKSKVLIDRVPHGELRFKHTNRLFSAMFDNKTKTLTYPLTITFLSGSADKNISLTASLNTRDSGIYDIYYRSGRPFFE